MDHGPQLPDLTGSHPGPDRRLAAPVMTRIALQRMEPTMSDTDTAESFPAMLRRVLGDRLKPDVTTFPDMFAEDGVMELPFAPPGLKLRLEGRDAIIAHLQTVTKLIKLDAMSNVITHETSDPDVIIVEFEGSGQGVITGEPYDQHYISVIRVRDGNIVHYKDYWNPIAVLRTLKGEETMALLAVG